MSYRFETGERVDDAARRIADEQIQGALATLDDLDHLGIVESVHDVRKRCKKLRGLARLVRPSLGGGFSRLNVHFRDLSRGLSAIRDAHAVLETFDHLVEANRHHAPGGFPSVRAELERRSEEVSASLSAGDERLDVARRQLRAGRLIAGSWDLGDDLDAIAAGVGATYARSRRALKRSATSPDDDALHDWRKRVKYLWYEVRLLEMAAPSVLTPMGDGLKALSDALGDDHDLAVLSAWLHAGGEGFATASERSELDLVLAHQRADLLRRSRRLGARLLAEDTQAFTARFGSYLATWRAVGDELPCGKITSLPSS
ncbi:MAG: CHAD domain-containing protein [Acidimicrobiales bacterium]